MVEARETNNLPMGIVVNRTMATLKKSKKVPVILVNTNSYNIWIQKPLLATNVVEVESCPWDYQTVLSHDGKDVNVSFCPVPTLEVQKEILSASMTQTGDSTDSTHSSPTKEQGESQSLGLDLSSMIFALIFRRNWIDFLSHSIWGKLICPKHNKLGFWS